MSTCLKKKTYHQETQIHTDRVFDIGCFFKSELKKKNKQRNMKWEISERILDDPNTTIYFKKVL